MSKTTLPERPTVVLKTLAIVGIVCLLLAVGILNLVPPADGFEISMYQVYPWYFWGLLIGSIFLGQTVIIGSVRYSEGRDRTWILGLVLVLLSGTILLLMPFIRGYPMYGGLDELTHIGYVRDISRVGIAGNIYPAMHLIIYAASSATGLELKTIIKLVPVVVSFVFVGGLFYMVRDFYSRTHALYTLPFVLVLFIGYKTSVPNTLSVMYIPFIIYLFISEQRTVENSMSFLLILATFGIVFLHPLTAFFLIITFGIYVAIEKTNWFTSKLRRPTMVPALTATVFSAWYLTFTGIVRRFEDAANGILGRTGGSALNSVSSTVSTYSPDPIDLATIAVLDYRLQLILYPLAGLFVMLAAYLWLRDEIELNKFVVLFSCIYIIFTAASLAAFVTNLGISWGRVMFYQNAFVTVLGASLFYVLYQRFSSRTWRRGISVSLGVVLLLLTALTVYGSVAQTATMGKNPHHTQMNIDGSEWVLENRDEEIPVDRYRLDLWRYEHFHYGKLNSSVRDGNAQPPEHFGYDRNETIGQSYTEDHYLIISELGRQTYPRIYTDYPQYWGFTPTDFEQLERDRTVSRLYDNGEVTLYYITAEE